MALTAQPIYFLKSRERYYHSNSKKPWPLPQFFFKSTFYFFSTFWWLRPYNPLIFKKLVTNIIQWRSQNLTQWVVHNCNHPIHHHHHACYLPPHPLRAVHHKNSRCRTKKSCRSSSKKFRNCALRLTASPKHSPGKNSYISYNWALQRKLSNLSELKIPATLATTFCKTLWEMLAWERLKGALFKA